MKIGGNRTKHEEFEKLVREHQRAIYGLCLNILGTEEDANEATQNSFFKAFNGFESFRGESAFKTWLYRIAINCSKTILRTRVKKRERHLESDISEIIVGVEPKVSEQIQEQEERKQMLAALDQLPQKQRLVLSLRVFEDLPFKDIAKLLKIREGSAKTNYHYAVKALKIKLGD